MAGVGAPAETRDTILERLIGDVGEPDRVTAAARSMAERAVPAIVEGIFEALSVRFEMEVGQVELTRLSETRPQPESHAVIAVAASSSSPDALMLVLDSNARALVVSTVFGADPGIPLTPIERDPSPIELEVAAAVFHQVATGLNGRGERSLDIRFPLAPPLYGTELKKLVVRDTPAVRIALAVSAPAGKCEVVAVMPQRVLLHHRGNGASGADQPQSAWGAYFGGEVMRSNVEVTATVRAARMTLGEIACLNVGDVFPFDEDAQANVQLAARGKTLFVCDFGRLGQTHCVRVREPFTPPNVIDDLLPGR